MDYKGKNIVVALSGGLDSSVAALLLKQKGANVKGLIMDLSPYLDSKKDIEDAQKIAEQLEIPLEIVNLSKEFREKVIQYFLDESWKGRTPNPCVPCNMFLKFGLLQEYAVNKLKADYYATGHYAIKKWDNKSKRWFVYRPKDIKKDQSSVLSMLSQKQLEKTIFPLGNIKKDEIRKIAEKYNLHSKNREESQDLCFLHEDKGDFIERVSKKKARKGKIINTKGEILGEHKGYIYYPLGQRKGLGVSAPNSLYVKKIDTKNNILTLGTRDELKTKEFYVGAVNWVAFEKLEKPIRAEVIVRNKQTPHKAYVYPIITQKNKVQETKIHKNTKKENCVKVVSDEPIFAVSPGQLAVFFKKDLILGGGWIE